MNTQRMFKAIVAGTGAYLPSKVLTNADLENTLDTSDEWIRIRTGIEERRIAAEDESSSVMAVKAGEMALQDASITAEEIDLVIVCTSTPDILFPATACLVQKELGAKGAAAYDISAVCSGFVFGLSIAERYLKSGRYLSVYIRQPECGTRIWSILVYLGLRTVRLSGHVSA